MEPVLGPRRIRGPQRPGAIIDIRIPNALALLAERGLAEAPGGPALGVVILSGPAAGESLRSAIGLGGGVAVQEVDPDDGDVRAVRNRSGE